MSRLLVFDHPTRSHRRPLGVDPGAVVGGLAVDEDLRGARAVEVGRLVDGELTGMPNEVLDRGLKCPVLPHTILNAPRVRASGPRNTTSEPTRAPLTSLSDPGDLQDELQPTFEGCESVSDWIAGAQQVVAEEIKPNTARLLLGIQCNDPSLSNSPVSEDLAPI